MKVTFIIKKAAKRYDTESTATIYIRLRNGRQLDSVAPTQLSINPNLWDDKAECVKTKAVCNEDLRTGINEEIRKLKTYVEKSFHTEKESVDKEWLKLTLDRYYHPEKYFTPEEIVIKPTFGELFDSFLEKHPLSEVRKKNFRVVKRALLRYELYVRETKRGQKAHAPAGHRRGAPGGIYERSEAGGRFLRTEEERPEKRAFFHAQKFFVFLSIFYLDFTDIFC